MHLSHAVSDIFALLYSYGDLILFPLVVIEGPIITIIAGFLASLRVFNPIPTYFVIISADLTADVLYYALGRWWLRSTFTKLINLFKIKQKTIDNLERNLRKNKGEVLFFGKLSHVFGLAILITAGHAKIPLSDFIWYNLLAAIPKSLIFFLVGYLLGNAINNYNKYVNLTILGLVAITLVMIIIYYFSKKITKEHLNHND